MEWIFLSIMLVGLLYLLLMIFGGAIHMIDVDGLLDSTGLDSVFGLHTDGGEATGLGCGVIATFLAGFGAVGLTGSLGAWNPLVMLLAAALFGWLLARGVTGLLRFVVAQQATDVFHNETLIGQYGRVTIDSAAGKIGEAMVEQGEIRKYAIREMSGAALHRNDIVEIVGISGRFLQVKKKRQPNTEEEVDGFSGSA